MKTFAERNEAMNKDIQLLQEKHKINIYAANVVMPNQEVIPVIRVSDMLAEQGNDMIINNEEKNEDKPKRRSAGNKKA